MPQVDEAPVCTRCGQCCTKAFIALHSVKKGEDKQEFARWLHGHRCGVKWMPFEDGHVLLVEVPLVCRHLTYDARGIAACKIYENRPVICREHKCLKLRKEVD